MTDYKELNAAWDDMLHQNKLYHPSSFWYEASQLIKNEIQVHGVERFRSLETVLGFFVPTYGMPGNSFSPELTGSILNSIRKEYSQEKKAIMALEQFLSGYMSALADYRVFVAADNPAEQPYLHKFSESNFGVPAEQFDFEGKYFSRSSLNYLLGLTMLKKHLKGFIPRRVLEIGGGFGTLGEILCKSGIEELRYIDIDIPPTSFVAQKYLSSIVGENNVGSYIQNRDKVSINIDSLPIASVLCSWQIENLVGEIDLFVNFISFQEMEPHIVRNYLNHVNRLSAKWVLLRNIREGKNKKNKDSPVGVEIPILSDDYLSMLENYSLVARNVVPFGFKTVDNFHSELLLLERKNEK